MSRRLAGASLPSVLGLLLVAGPAAAQEDPIIGPKVIEPVYVGKSIPLTELAEGFADGSVSLASLDAGEALNPDLDLRALKTSTPISSADTAGPRATGDPVRQHFDPFHGTTPEPTLSFEGTTDQDNGELTGTLIVPPDTEGDVGYRYYAQMNNIVFEIFDKRDGTSVLGPLPNNLFWAGTGTFCEQWNDGDPVVLFDHQARRWIFSQFALFEYLEDEEYYVSHQCFAVSKTPDPLGPYYLYDFVTATPEMYDGAYAAFNDYPKLGIWTDGIYYSANDFEYTPSGSSFANASVIAFNKWAMYWGMPAIGIQFKIGPVGATDEIYYSLLPSHWEGHIRPPFRAPNTFWQMWDSEEFTFSGSDGPDGVLHWDFYANFWNPARSRLVPRGLIEMPEYESYVCSGSGRNCVDQPEPGDIASGNGIDPIDFRLMFRTQYRNFGWYGSTVVSATVDADGDPDNGQALAGIRWAELRRGWKGWRLHQSGTFAPDDGEQRLMPSIAQNRKGQIALGYTVSSLATYPAVRYTMRNRFDPLGEMSGGEMSCFEGSGSQIDSFNRWGDYSAMSVDPSNDCSFWYTNEYYDTTGDFDFKTRICKFNRCGFGYGKRH
jgi:hypothetical protein